MNKDKKQSPIDKREDNDTLSEAELRYRTVFEQSPYGILIIDTDGALIEFNEAAHRQLGYSREEFAGLSISDIDPFETPEEIRSSITEVLNRGKAEFEVRHRTKDGEIRNVHVITQSINLSGRTVFHTLWHDITKQKTAERELTKYREHLEEQVKGRTAELTRVNEQLGQDIAKRRQLQDKLRESEERFRLIAETSVDLIFQVDLQGIITYCSSSVEQFGYRPKEIMGRRFEEYFSSSEAPRAIEAFRWAIFGQTIRQFELNLLGKDGTLKHCEVNITPVIRNGQVTGIQGIARDITDRKQAEKEREKLIQELQDALANIKTLRGLIPMCAWCKKIREDSGYWKKVETYIQDHSDASFTHGICPDCLKKHDPLTYEEVFENERGDLEKEKRRSKRTQLTNPLDCVLSVNGGGTQKMLLHAAIENISDAGMCVRTDRPLEKGREVTFSDGKEDRTGIVRWQEKYDSEHETYRVGIQFVKE